MGIKNYDLHCVSGKYYIKYNTFFSLGLHVFNSFSPQSLWNYSIIQLSNYLIISFFFLFLFWSIFFNLLIFFFSPSPLFPTFSLNIYQPLSHAFLLPFFLSHNLIPNS